MKYFVNDSCIGCGLCESECPDIFHLKDGRAEAEDRDVPADLESSAAAAKDGCPVSAIQEK